MIDIVRRRTPWHLWLIGVLALLWNGFGAYDFVMTFGQGDPYMRSMGMTDPQIAYFRAMPAWMYVVWGIGTIGGLAGAVLLLARRRLATAAFGLSLIGMIVSFAYTHLFSDGAEVLGGGQTIMAGVITLIGVILVLYSAAMSKRGMLR